MISPSNTMGGFGVSVHSTSKSFKVGSPVLHNLNLEINAGECVALIGASGSGKSTLLRLLPGFMPADAGSGKIHIGPHKTQSNGHINSAIRQMRTDIGFIFQQFNLVRRLDVLTNVLIGVLPRMPFWRSALGQFTTNERQMALSALEAVGLADCAKQRASTLSGGQQQRVAIARCIVQRARVILADEPIASLDPESARNVMEILSNLSRDKGVTVLVSLHQVAFARRFCQRTIALRSGEIVHDGPSSELKTEMLHKLYGTTVDELLEHSEEITSK
jgi:phosphonate transport system ATP-binding protein